MLNVTDAYFRLSKTTYQGNRLTWTTNAHIKEAMVMPVSIKIDPRMKKALEKLAKREFTSVSSLLKKGAEKVLQENDIDWRKEKE